MLPVPQRLRAERDIAAVVRQGRVVRARYIRIHYRHAERSASRAACVVGRSVYRQATKRHRLQRWLRVLAAHVIVFRDQHQAPLDMVWVALPRAAGVPTQRELRATIWPYLAAHGMVEFPYGESPSSIPRRGRAR